MWELFGINVGRFCALLIPYLNHAFQSISNNAIFDIGVSVCLLQNFRRMPELVLISAFKCKAEGLSCRFSCVMNFFLALGQVCLFLGFCLRN
jgi:hypothetical protein